MIYLHASVQVCLSFQAFFFYAREDDALRQPLLGEGQALRELFRCPLVHGVLLCCIRTRPHTTSGSPGALRCLWKGTAADEGNAAVKQTGIFFGAGRRGFNCSDKRPRPERRSAAKRERKQQWLGRLAIRRDWWVAQGAACSAEWAVSMAVRRRQELMDTSAGETLSSR